MRHLWRLASGMPKHPLSELIRKLLPLRVVQDLVEPALSLLPGLVLARDAVVEGAGGGELGDAVGAAEREEQREAELAGALGRAGLGALGLDEPAGGRVLEDERVGV